MSTYMVTQSCSGFHKERKMSHPFLNYLYRAALSTLRSFSYLADPDIFTHQLM